MTRTTYSGATKWPATLIDKQWYIDNIINTCTLRLEIGQLYQTVIYIVMKEPGKISSRRQTTAYAAGHISGVHDASNRSVCISLEVDRIRRKRSRAKRGGGLDCSLEQFLTCDCADITSS